MAVRDGDGAEPRFGGDGVPCLVFWGLLAILDDGTARRVDTDQDDDAWGLCFSVDGPNRWKVRERFRSARSPCRRCDSMPSATWWRRCSCASAAMTCC